MAPRIALPVDIVNPPQKAAPRAAPEFSLPSDSMYGNRAEFVLPSWETTTEGPGSIRGSGEGFTGLRYHRRPRCVWDEDRIRVVSGSNHLLEAICQKLRASEPGRFRVKPLLVPFPILT